MNPPKLQYYNVREFMSVARSLLIHMRFHHVLRTSIRSKQFASCDSRQHTEGVEGHNILIL